MMSKLAATLVLLLAAACMAPAAAQQYEEDGRPKEYGIFCGRENCYEVLGVEADANDAGIKKAYRKLARDLHPDRNKGEDAKEKFQRVAAAYETLRDPAARKDYDYLLAHPDLYARNIFRHFKGKAAPRIGVVPILVALVVVVSAFQHGNKVMRHKNIINSNLTRPDFRKRALKEGQAQGTIKKKMSQEDVAAVVDGIIISNLGLETPDIMDCFGAQVVKSPITLTKLALWYADYYKRIKINKEELTDDDKTYMIRKNAGLSQNEFDQQTADWHDLMWEIEAWDTEAYAAHAAKEAEKARQKLLNSTAYKRDKRSKKKGIAAADNYND